MACYHWRLEHNMSWNDSGWISNGWWWCHLQIQPPSRLIDKHLDNDNLLAWKYLGELGISQKCRRFCCIEQVSVNNLTDAHYQINASYLTSKVW